MAGAKGVNISPHVMFLSKHLLFSVLEALVTVTNRVKLQNGGTDSNINLGFLNFLFLK